MVTIDAATVSDNLGDLWNTAAREPVTIESAGKAIAVVLSPEDYTKLSAPHQRRKAGTMKDLFAGVDVNALLATSLDDAFSDYM